MTTVYVYLINQYIKNVVLYSVLKHGQGDKGTVAKWSSGTVYSWGWLLNIICDVIFVVHIFYENSGSCQISPVSQAQSTLQSLAAEHRTFVAKKKVRIRQHFFQVKVSLFSTSV